MAEPNTAGLTRREMLQVDGATLQHLSEEASPYGEYYKPDLIMIPIGGHFVMDPKDAAYATTQMLKPKYAIPFHYATSPVLKGTPQEYQAALGQTSTQVFPISPGDKLTF